MPDATIQRRDVRSLAEFYALIEETRAVRARIAEQVLAGQPAHPADFEGLENAREALGDVPAAGGQRVLKLDDERTIQVDLAYEVNELAKDLLWLSAGEEGFLAHLAELHDGFSEQVQAGVDALAGQRFEAFITDRDGTINNYCGRYRSSVQPAYNAVFLTRFARACCKHPIIVTSAPLAGPGLVDVSVLPEGALVCAASKGREFIDLTGTRRSFPIAEEDQALLDRLNERLKALVARPGCERFGLIGSGLQFKFGQTTIARQDITGTIPEADSEAWRAKIEALVAELDPAGDKLVIEDTGLDLEIILTIGGEEGARDFSKADAVRYLAGELGIDLDHGPHLVCGDTAGDVPLVEAVVERDPTGTRTVFVTTKEDLRARVTEVCGDALFVSTPDVLVTVLGELGKQAGSGA